ncbi:VOC family protein [Actinophytocola sp.]|uniref:VOC family protein n=1 Tax=Actinophytocola sp. TaxID=1872138 RepID=UPI00389A0C00
MNLDLGGITIDCTDPHALAEFWTHALDLEVAHAGDEYVQLVSRADRSRPYLGLQKVPEAKAGKNRVHLDLATNDPDGEIARLVALGATAGDKYEEPGLRWTVLFDPAGNEFCVGTLHD